MIVDKLVLWVEMVQEAIGLFLPTDIVLWLIALVMLILVLAAWRMIH